MHDEDKPIPPVSYALMALDEKTDTLIELMSKLAEKLQQVRAKTSLPKGMNNPAMRQDLTEQGDSPLVEHISTAYNKLVSVENQIRAILEDIEI